MREPARRKLRVTLEIEFREFTQAELDEMGPGVEDPLDDPLPSDINTNPMEIANLIPYGLKYGQEEMMCGSNIFLAPGEAEVLDAAWVDDDTDGDNTVEVGFCTIADLPPRKVLAAAADQKFDHLWIVGYLEDKELYVASSTSDVGSFLLAIEDYKVNILYPWLRED